MFFFSEFKNFRKTEVSQQLPTNVEWFLSEWARRETMDVSEFE